MNEARGARLLLASASPRRREMLERVGVALEIVPADIDETPVPNETPAQYVARVALAKALAVAARQPPHAFWRLTPP